MLRQVMLWAMVIAGGIAIGNLVLRRNRWLNGTALALVLLTLAAGGHPVHVVGAVMHGMEAPQERHLVIRTVRPVLHHVGSEQN